MSILPDAPRGAEAPSRPEPAPKPRPRVVNDLADDPGDWSLSPGAASRWPNWTDRVRVELGPEPCAVA